MGVLLGTPLPKPAGITGVMLCIKSYLILGSVNELCVEVPDLRTRVAELHLQLVALSRELLVARHGLVALGLQHGAHAAAFVLAWKVKYPLSLSLVRSYKI